MACDIIAAVAEMTGYSVHQLKGVRRNRELSRARQVAFWLLRRHRPHLSFSQIGSMFGGRDHSTVIHGVQLVDHVLGKCDTVTHFVRAVERRLGMVSSLAKMPGQSCRAIPTLSPRQAVPAESVQGKLAA